MRKIGLFDGSFPHQKSFTLGCDREGHGPQYFEWERDTVMEFREFTFFTDMCLKDAVNFSGKKVALLIEPPSLSSTHYDFILENKHLFDYVLSFWKPFLELLPDGKGLFYPLGGSWVKLSAQGVKRKSRKVCMIVSQKKGSPLHRTRHSIVSRHSTVLDVYGRGYAPFDEKWKILRPYQYAVIVESWKGADYFSEKLTDAISMGCVPIYNGCPNIAEYFNRFGILNFQSMSALDHILNFVISDHDYNLRLEAITENYFRCQSYQCAEDWIYEQYPFLFA